MGKLRAYFVEEFRAGKLLSPVQLSSSGGPPRLAMPCINGIIRQVGNEEDRTLEVVASDESIDRYEEVISVTGWDLKNYRKNPVVLFGHDYHSLPVGQSLKVWKSLDGEAKQLRSHMRFATAEAHPFAESVYRLLQGGELRTVSVGFLPWDWEDPEGEVPRDGDGRATAPQRTYRKQELLEISVVPVPANPNALVDAVRRGIIKEDTFNLLTRKYHMPAEREVIDLRRWASLREPERVVEEEPAETVEKTSIMPQPEDPPAEVEAKPDKTTIQSLVLSKDVFKTESAAKKWVTDNDFKAGTPDETENSWRFRQFNPDQCKEGSFKTIKLTDGVQAVICHKKEAEAPAPEPERPKSTLVVEYLVSGGPIGQPRHVVMSPEIMENIAAQENAVVEWREAEVGSFLADRVLETARGLALRRAFDSLPEEQRKAIEAATPEGERLDMTKDPRLLTAYLVTLTGGCSGRFKQADDSEEQAEVVILNAIMDYLGQLAKLVLSGTKLVGTLIGLQGTAPTPEADAAEDELEEAYLEVLHAAFEQMCGTIATMQHLTCELQEDEDMGGGNGDMMLALRAGAVLNAKNLARVKAIKAAADEILAEAETPAETPAEGESAPVLVIGEAEPPAEAPEALLEIGESAIAPVPAPETPAPPSPEGQEGTVIEVDPAMLARAVKEGVQEAIGQVTGNVRFARGVRRK